MTLLSNKRQHTGKFLDHISSLNLHITFTTEDLNRNGLMPFFGHTSNTRTRKPRLDNTLLKKFTGNPYTQTSI